MSSPNPNPFYFYQRTTSHNEKDGYLLLHEHHEGREFGIQTGEQSNWQWDRGRASSHRNKDRRNWKREQQLDQQYD